MKPEAEIKYRNLRYIMIVLFGAIFVMGLLARGMMPQARGNNPGNNDSKYGWKTTHIDNISYYDTQNIKSRRDIMDRLRDNPRSPELHNEMGIALAKDGLFSEAMTHFFDAIELDPRNAAAYHNLGIIHEYLEAYDEARVYLEKARKLDPENKTISGTLKRVDFVLEYQPGGRERYEAELNKALIAMGKNNTDLDYAGDILEELIVENPAGTEALNALGIVYARKGDSEKAKKTFLKILAQEPGYILAYLNLATVSESQNDYSGAYEYLERAMNLADDRAAEREIENRMRSLKEKMPVR